MKSTMQSSALQGGLYPPSRTSLRNRRLATAIALGLSLLYVPAIALAQDTGQPASGSTAQPAKPDAKTDADKSKDKKKTADGKDVENLDGVTVTGIRASLESSQSLKQNASQIIDSVTASDINALPDRSVTETLQRISGVTVDHFLADDDPDHPSAEGSSVLIRGLPYVASLLNGRESFSANNGRSLGFEDVPAELMAGVDVYKNPSAEMIEGGIGGTVDLRTRMPFDNPGQLIAFSGGVNEGDMAKKSKPSASFLYSNRWHSDDLGEFGALIDVSYSELATRSDGIQTNPYVLRPNATDTAYYAPNIAAGSPTSNVYVPGDINWQEMDMQRRRTGIYGAFQWRPNDNLELSSQFFRSNYNLQWNEHWVQTNESNYNDVLPAAGTQFNYNDQGVFTSGEMASNAWKGSPPAGPNGAVEYYTDNRMQTQFTRTTDWSNSFKYNLSDNMLLSGSVQFVKSTSNTVDFSVYNQFYMPPAYVTVTGTPSLVSSNPGFFANSANYYLAAAMDHLEYDYAMERTARVDLEYNFVDSSWLQFFRVGLRATDRDADSNNTNSNYNWGPISQVWQGGYTGPSSLDWANTIPSWMEQSFSMGNFFRGANLPTTLWFPSNALVSNYARAVNALYQIEMANSGSWQSQEPLVGTLGYNASLKENTQAAYAALYFGNEEALGVPFDGNIGARLVYTQLNAMGSVLNPTSSNLSGNTSTLTPEQAALFNGEYYPLNGRNDYHNVLPSLNLRFKFTDDLQLRLAASKGMSRPDLSQLYSYLKLGASWGGAAGQEASFQGFTGSSTGNPALKPMTANQYDLALEWYFAPTGQLYTTLFKKDIHNYITNEVFQQEVEGQQVAVSGPVNAGTGNVKGGEVGYSQFFDFLPGALKGLGLQANYTYLQSSKIYGTTSCDPNHANGSCSPQYIVTNPGLPMAGLSTHSYNVIGMYEYGNWSGRLAWSWRSRYLITPDDTGDTYLPMWNAASGQLDASVFYHFNKNMQIGLQMNNLSNTTQKVLMGPTTYTTGQVDYNLYTRSLFMNDRRYELVFRATF
ncbi:TonB-dependent receptor [Dyella sp. C9]|uniref:TonB-dependent receptor n=1 Tax=Dyella sp. C9 TaxID=2202154 RepID=UPI001E50A3B5|nr:TonB-dependent receptor [Dyella sp. C9]